MRQTSTLLFAALTVVYFSSYSTGPARGGVDGTSSGLSNSTKCASCHSGGSFGNVTSFTLLDAEGQAQTSYRPGETYKVRVEIATTTTPGGYGFQLLLIDGQKAQAGTYGTPPANTRISTLGGRNYLEQMRRLSSGTIEADWTAPASGTGTITAYAVGNAVNANGGTSGDQPNEAIVTLTESGPSSTRELLWPAKLAVGQAPGTILLHGSAGFGESPYLVELHDLNGRRLRSEVLAEAGLQLNGLLPGVHILSLIDGEGRRAARLVVVLP